MHLHRLLVLFFGLIPYFLLIGKWNEKYQNLIKYIDTAFVFPNDVKEVKEFVDPELWGENK